VHKNNYEHIEKKDELISLANSLYVVRERKEALP
jgi:hypothetical protein